MPIFTKLDEVLYQGDASAINLSIYKYHKQIRTSRILALYEVLDVNTGVILHGTYKVVNNITVTYYPIPDCQSVTKKQVNELVAIVTENYQVCEKERKRFLVACQAGLSRSPLVSALTLYIRGVCTTFMDAVKYVKHYNPAMITSPHMISSMDKILTYKK